MQEILSFHLNEGNYANFLNFPSPRIGRMWARELAPSSDYSEHIIGVVRG